MFAPPTCPIATFEVGGYTFHVSCVQKVLTPQQHCLLPVPPPPQFHHLRSCRAESADSAATLSSTKSKPLRIVKHIRSQKTNHSARLRSRSQTRHDVDPERHQSWSHSAHADSHHHWSAATSDNCVISHDRRPIHSQSKSWSNASQEKTGPCPNNATCHNEIVPMRHNMLWCTACWADMSQEQQVRYHREANNTEDITISH